MNDNGEKVEFKQFIKIGRSDEGKFIVQTNVSDLLMGYGMLEFAKEGVRGHIIKLQQQKKAGIVVPR